MTDWVKPPGARGTAAMHPDKRREVARLGGLKSSENRERMAEIGKKGGSTVREKYGRDYFSNIGRKGGASKRKED